MSEELEMLKKRMVELVEKSLDTVERMQKILATLHPDCVEQRENLEWHIAWHYARVERLTTKHDVEPYTVENSQYYANAA